MAFDLSALQQWKEEIGDVSQIILKPIEIERTFDYVDKRSGIKGQNVLLPVLFANPTIVAGETGNCAFSDTGGQDAITQFSITTIPYKINKGICLENFEKYFTTQWLPKTSMPDTFAAIDTYVANLIANVSKEVGKIYWISDTAIGAYPALLKASDGFLKKIDASGVAVTYTGPAGAVLGLTTDSTAGTVGVLEVFDKLIYELLPKRNFGTSRIIAFCGVDTFLLLQNAIKNKNYFHYTPADIPTGYRFEMQYFNTPVTVVGVSGLNNDNDPNQPNQYKDRIVVSYAENFTIGFNVENDMNDFNLWYSQDFQELRIKMRFHLGVAVKFPELVATFKRG